MLSSMSRSAPAIVLAPEERAILEGWTRGRRRSYRTVVRAKIITMAADRVPNQDIAAALKVSRPTVQLWRERFLALRVAGLEQDAPRPGRTPRVSVQKVRAVVEATLHTAPPAATHWSTRTMARAHGLSRDPRFVEKLTDVVGLYLNPPDKALVLCVDEKSQIQALDRTHPGLPLKRGRCGTHTRDYKRNGTTTLFAALSMLDGKVIGDCMPRHRHQEFIRFLKRIDGDIPTGLDLHLIVDNYGTHKHPRVIAWLRRHPRFHLHFIPTSSSWLNLVERWFRELTDKRIRRGVFQNVPALIAAIHDYLSNHNQHPQVFVWSAPVERILAKIAKCKEALESLH
jgi:transposase